MKNGKRAKAITDTANERIVLRAVAVLTAAVLLRFALLLAFGTAADAWGWSYSAYQLWEADIILVLMLPLLLLSRRIRRGIGKLLMSENTHSSSRGIMILLVLLPAAVLYIMSYPVLAALLGDGSIILSEVFRLYESPATADFFLKPTSFLTGVLIQGVVAVYDSRDLRAVFTVLGLIAFALMALFNWWYLRGEKRAIVVLFSAGLLLSAGALFFFRYVELYQMQYVFVAGYYLAAWRMLRRGTSILEPVAMFCIATLFGAAALIHLPTLIILVLSRRSVQENVQWHRALMLSAAPPVMAVVLALINENRVDSPFAHYVIPLSKRFIEGGGENLYTLFSPQHMVDVLNALWLHAGPALVACVALFVVSSATRLRFSHTGQFAIAGLSSSITFVLFANALYGLSQDWDLVAIIAPAFIFTIAAMAESRLQAYGAAVSVVVIGFLLLQIGQFHSWVRINASSASAERFASLVHRNTGVVPPWNTFRSLENLRSYYGSVGDAVKEVQVLFRQYSLGVRKDVVFRSMQVAFTRLPGEARREVLEHMCDLLRQEAMVISTSNETSEARRLREFTASTFLLANSPAEHELVQRYIGEFSTLFSSWPEIGIYYAAANTRLTNQQRLEITAMSLRASAGDPSLTSVAGWFCEQGGDARQAVSFYERTIELAPGEYPGIYLRLAQVLHEKLDDVDSAIKVLQSGMTACPFAPERRDMQQLVEEYRHTMP